MRQVSRAMGAPCEQHLTERTNRVRIAEPEWAHREMHPSFGADTSHRIAATTETVRLMRFAILSYTLAPDAHWSPSLLPTTGSWEERSTESEVERKFAALLSEADYTALRHEWTLGHGEPNGGAITEYGHLSGDLHLFDPMDWNTSGVTPLVDASLFVSAPLARR